MWARGRLEHLALTTFAVEPVRLARLLLPGVEPTTVATGAGADVALVSAVSFVARDLRVEGLPLAGFSGGHVDYRAAVRLRGERAVWFLGAAMSSPLAWALRGLWGMPWHRASVAIVHDGDAYRADVADHRWRAHVEAGTSSTAGAGLDGFDHVDHAAEVLVNARLGLFRGRGGRLRAYRAVHDPPQPRPAGIRGPARVSLFEALGLVAPGAAPHSVLLVGGFDIAIELPPRSI